MRDRLKLWGSVLYYSFIYHHFIADYEAVDTDTRQHLSIRRERVIQGRDWGK